jgi:hypothetical protein
MEEKQKPLYPKLNNTTPRLMAVLTKDWIYFDVNKRVYVNHYIGETFPIIDTIGGCLNMAGDLIYDGIFVIPSSSFKLRPPTEEEIKIANEK